MARVVLVVCSISNVCTDSDHSSRRRIRSRIGSLLVCITLTLDERRLTAEGRDQVAVVVVSVFVVSALVVD